MFLIDRYRRAGLKDISHDFYPGGRHEMLNEINRDEVQARLLNWISSLLEKLQERDAGDSSRALAPASDGNDNNQQRNKTRE